MKIAVEKIGNVSRMLKKMFEVWMRQVARPSHQDMKLLGLATPSIWPGNLQCGRAYTSNFLCISWNIEISHFVLKV